MLEGLGFFGGGFFGRGLWGCGGGDDLVVDGGRVVVCVLCFAWEEEESDGCGGVGDARDVGPFGGSDLGEVDAEGLEESGSGGGGECGFALVVVVFLEEILPVILPLT